MAMRRIEQYDEGHDLQGIPYSHEWIEASQLAIGAHYQRRIDQRWVKRLAADFDPFLLDDLLINRELGGRLIVMDGQHRLEAIRAMGWGDQRVPCKVYENLPAELQAKRFNVQSVRKLLSAQDRFRSALDAHAPDETMVDAIVRRAGFSINLDNGEVSGGRIACVAELLRLHKNARGDMLAETLAVIADALGREDGPQHATVAGVSRFLTRYRRDERYERRRLLEVLRRMTGATVAAEGKDAARVLGRTIYDGTAFAIWKAYNHRLLDHHRLPDFLATDGRKARG